MQFITSITALLLIGASTVAALPSADVARAADNFHVLVRDADGAYNRSPQMEKRVIARDVGTLHKRSHATVQACYNGDCSNCHTVFDGSLGGNSGCISATNTQCLIISNLDDANVEFWNNSGCNGNNSVYRGCGQASANVGAPGTNSLGIHTGC